jgi:hypothetical protein
MNWLRRAPSPEKVAVDETVQKLSVVREKRRNALRELVRKLDEIPLDDGLVKIGDDLARTPEGGH